MKNRSLILVLVVVLFAGILTLCLIRFAPIVGEEGLIAKARREITNLAEVDSIEMAIAGESTFNHYTHLFWFVTGNENQMQRYYPMEFVEKDEETYRFVRKYNGGTKRGQDIYVLEWKGGYSFLINNPDCKTLIIRDYDGETSVPVDQTPFVYYHPLLPGEYAFLDRDGNEIW